MALDRISNREIKIGEEEYGLGCWSYVTIEGEEGKKLAFIT